jgi:hypothetical protein
MGVRRKKEGMSESRGDGHVGLAYGEISREAALQAN